MTIKLFDQNLQAYAESKTTVESPLLEDLNKYTQESVAMPIMLSGHLQGRILSMISRLKRPQNILDIGTYTGYSAICLAEGLAENGEIVTIDKNSSLSEKTKTFLDKSPFAKQIKFLEGDAKELIPELNTKWDLVFIDADKRGYSTYFDLVIENMNKGGFIIADNVLYNGEVLLPQGERQKNAEAINKFNQKIYDDPRVQQVLLPVRDGLLVIEKL